MRDRDTKIVQPFEVAPGNANLRIGVLPKAIQENGAPGHLRGMCRTSGA